MEACDLLARNDCRADRKWGTQPPSIAFAFGFCEMAPATRSVVLCICLKKHDVSTQVMHRKLLRLFGLASLTSSMLYFLLFHSASQFLQALKRRDEKSQLNSCFCNFLDEPIGCHYFNGDNYKRVFLLISWIALFYFKLHESMFLSIFKLFHIIFLSKATDLSLVCCHK